MTDYEYLKDRHSIRIMGVSCLHIGENFPTCIPESIFSDFKNILHFNEVFLVTEGVHNIVSLPEWNTYEKIKQNHFQSLLLSLYKSETWKEFQYAVTQQSRLG